MLMIVSSGSRTIVDRKPSAERLEFPIEDRAFILEVRCDGFEARCAKNDRLRPGPVDVRPRHNIRVRIANGRCTRKKFDPYVVSFENLEIGLEWFDVGRVSSTKPEEAPVPVCGSIDVSHRDSDVIEFNQLLRRQA